VVVTDGLATTPGARSKWQFDPATRDLRAAAERAFESRGLASRCLCVGWPAECLLSFIVGIPENPQDSGYEPFGVFIGFVSEQV
jgi:hypothetical protein